MPCGDWATENLLYGIAGKFFFLKASPRALLRHHTITIPAIALRMPCLGGRLASHCQTPEAPSSLLAPPLGATMAATRR